MLRHLFTLGVAYAASCPGYIATQCICEGDQGVGYEGTMDHSDKGIKCMDWKDAPNKRYRDKGLPANYCRNANGYDGGVWCFTEGGSWDYCDVPTCGCKDFNPSECGCSDFKQADYRGTINVTKSGKPCQAWDSQTPNIHPFVPGTSEYDHYGMESNYCRNPGMMAETPWCYIAEDSGLPSDKTWDVCDIPVCGGDTITTTTTSTTPEPTTIAMEPTSTTITNTTKPTTTTITDTTKPATTTITTNTTTTTTTTTRTYANEAVIDYFHKGWYTDNKTYGGIGARGKTKQPLTNGAVVSVKIDGHWARATTKSDGTWEYVDWKERKVGEKATIDVAVFDKKGKQISPTEHSHADGKHLNKLTLISQKEGLRTGDKYTGISANGSTAEPLRDGEHIVAHIDGKKQERNIETDRSGNWSFKDDTERKVGTKVNVYVAVVKNRVYGTGGINFKFDGSKARYNVLRKVRFHKGWYVDGKKFAGVGAKGKTMRPLTNGSFVSMKIDGYWKKAKNKSDGTWEYSDWKDRKVGTKTTIEVAVFDKKGIQISDSVTSYADGERLNKVILGRQHQGFRKGNVYAGISAEGKTAKPLRDGDKIVAYIDGKKRIVGTDKSGKWSFKDDTPRKIGTKVDVYVAVVNNRVHGTGGITVKFDGKYIFFSELELDQLSKGFPGW